MATGLPRLAAPPDNVQRAVRQLSSKAASTCKYLELLQIEAHTTQEELVELQQRYEVSGSDSKQEPGAQLARCRQADERVAQRLGRISDLIRLAQG